MTSQKPWNELYQAVGECLHAWSSVETELTHLFMIFHRQPWNDFNHPLRAAFEAAISLEVRLAMLRASVQADDELRDVYAGHFNALQNRIRKSYAKRHEVAHFTLIGRGDPGMPTKHMIRPFFTWRDFTENTGVELDLTQVQERTVRFFELTERVRQHVQYVGEKRGLPPSHFAQAGHIAYASLDEETSGE